MEGTRISAISESLDQETAEKLILVLLGEIRWSSDICDRQVAEEFWKVVTSAVRNDWNKMDISNKLHTNASFERIICLLEKYANQLKNVLQTVKWDYPELTDVKCEVVRDVQPYYVSRLAVPSTTISLHYVPNGLIGEEKMNVKLNKDQLMDFHSKVKEAVNAYNHLRDIKKK